MKISILILATIALAAYTGHKVTSDRLAVTVADLNAALDQRGTDLAQARKAIESLNAELLAVKKAAAESAATDDRAGRPYQEAATATAPAPAMPDPEAAARAQAAAQAARIAQAQAAHERAVNDLEARATLPARQLAEARARRDQIAAMQGGFAEQTTDPKTGRKSGIRTSDADRQKWQAAQAAELHRLDAYIRDRQRALDELAAERARLDADLARLQSSH